MSRLVKKHDSPRDAFASTLQHDEIDAAGHLRAVRATSRPFHFVAPGREGSIDETRDFAAQALTRRLKVIGLVPATV